MSGLTDQAQEELRASLIQRLRARVAALEGEKDEYLKRLDEVNVARQENEVRAILAERSVADLEGERDTLREAALALAVWTHHKSHCARRVEAGSCDCGLNDAWAALASTGEGEGK